MIEYYDLVNGNRTPDIDAIMSDWQGDSETLVVFCPHDDDALLGAGYAILAGLAEGAAVHIFIFCDGGAGYSKPEERQDIVARRKAETILAYAELGIAAENIVRFDYPDFSLAANISRQLPGGEAGTMPGVVSELRRLKATRLFLPNPYREHADHQATWQIGIYDGPQVGDAVLADWGDAPPIKSYLEYSVWGKFSPERPADRAVKLDWEEELKIRQGLGKWQSQAEIIEGLLAARDKRKVGDQGIEVYRTVDTRVPLDYAPYRNIIRKIDGGK